MKRDDQLVFDVGLHQGEDAEFYLKKGYRVVAFEANPTLVENCRARFVDEIRSGQLRIVAGAISPPSQSGKVTFYVNETHSFWGTTEPEWVKRNEAWGAPSHPVEVDRIDIADAFRRFGVPFYLKIDIEGADGLVLDALRGFEDRPRYISIEANSVTRDLFASDLRTLENLGYRHFQLVPQARLGGSILYGETVDGEMFEHVFATHGSGPFGPDLGGTWEDRETIFASFSDEQAEGWQDVHVSLSSDSLTNLALKRPSTQSSTSAWSTHPDPESDARVANNGEIHSEAYFHTEVEANPWWQVDLGEVCVVEKVVIHNRLELEERLAHFSILGSSNGEDWSQIFRKTDDKRFTTLTVRLSKAASARWIRVRLDGRGCLHFRECQVIGQRPDVAELSGLEG